MADGGGARPHFQQVSAMKLAFEGEAVFNTYFLGVGAAPDAALDGRYAIECDFDFLGVAV